MKNILIYFPYNHRTVEQQSVMEMLVRKGHRVFLLTLLPENDLHRFARSVGVEAAASPVTTTSRFPNIFSNARYLISFCKKNQIDIILAHQQLCALPLIFARPFIKAKSFYIRHNANEDYIRFPKKAWLMNRFINTMLPAIIAPSNIVYKYMVEHEKVSFKKIRRINYGYNFSQYEKPDESKVLGIKNQYSSKLLVISIARLVPVKRHDQMFQAVGQLIAKGLDIKMICLGDGYLKNELQQWIDEKSLSDKIFLLGMRRNIFDYLSAADVLLHLSETEASNSVVKEAGLTKRTAIVCEKVGDFSDYIIDAENGFLVNKEHPLQEVASVLEKLYHNNQLLVQAGERLQQTIIKEFDINNVSLQYDELINNA